MTALEVFEVPGILGLPGKTYVFSTRIYAALHTTLGTPAYGLANALAIIYVALSIAAIYFYSRTIGRSERYAVISGKGYRPRPVGLGQWRWIGLAFCVFSRQRYSRPAALLPRKEKRTTAISFIFFSLAFPEPGLSCTGVEDQIVPLGDCHDRHECIAPIHPRRRLPAQPSGCHNPDCRCGASGRRGNPMVACNIRLCPSLSRAGTRSNDEGKDRACRARPRLG